MDNPKIKKLIDGNNRFLKNELSPKKNISKDLSKGQSPHTIIITCCDSRVAPELIFDQDLGEMFVIRIAGNIITDEVIGSVEFAAMKFKSSACVVLGHTHCGAVTEALNFLQTGTKAPSCGLNSIVGPIARGLKDKFDQFDNTSLNSCIDWNVKSSLKGLIQKSEILKDLRQNGAIELYGAKYFIESRRVEFFDDFTP